MTTKTLTTGQRTRQAIPMTADRETMLGEIMFACLLQVGESEQVEPLRAQEQRLIEKVCATLGREFSLELEDAIYSLCYAHAEAMFAMGWHLAMHPELIATLPTPE